MHASPTTRAKHPSPSSYPALHLAVLPPALGDKPRGTLVGRIAEASGRLLECYPVVSPRATALLEAQVAMEARGTSTNTEFPNGSSVLFLQQVGERGSWVKEAF